MQFQIIPVKNVQRSFKIKRTDFWVLQIIDKTPYFFPYQGKGMVFTLKRKFTTHNFSRRLRHKGIRIPGK